LGGGGGGRSTGAAPTHATGKERTQKPAFRQKEGGIGHRVDGFRGREKLKKKNHRYWPSGSVDDTHTRPETGRLGGGDREVKEESARTTGDEGKNQTEEKGPL